jgi:hypothetical protein
MTCSRDISILPARGHFCFALTLTLRTVDTRCTEGYRLFGAKRDALLARQFDDQQQNACYPYCEDGDPRRLPRVLAVLRSRRARAMLQAYGHGHKLRRTGELQHLTRGKLRPFKVSRDGRREGHRAGVECGGQQFS